MVLDDLLGTMPVQMRETEENESPEFMALFPNLIILGGGVDSGCVSTFKLPPTPKHHD